MAFTRNQRTTNATENNNGRYSQGGLTDRLNNRLGWWERYPMPRQTDDIVFTITKKYERRADLVAQQVYKQVSFMWLVLQYNNIVDINEELVVGKKLFLPTPQRVAVTIATRSTGGNVV